MPRLTIYPIEHRKEKRIALDFDTFPCKELDQITRSLPKRKFSASKKLWHIPLEEGYQFKLTKAFEKASNLVELVFKEPNTTAPHPNNSSTTQAIENTNSQKVKIRIDKPGKRFYVDHGYCRRLFEVLNNLEEGFWSKKHKNWIFSGDNQLYRKVINIIEKNGFLWEKQHFGTNIQATEELPVEVPKSIKIQFNPPQQEILD